VSSPESLSPEQTAGSIQQEVSSAPFHRRLSFSSHLRPKSIKQTAQHMCITLEHDLRRAAEHTIRADTSQTLRSRSLRVNTRLSVHTIPQITYYRDGCIATMNAIEAEVGHTLLSRSLRVYIRDDWVKLSTKLLPCSPNLAPKRRRLWRSAICKRAPSTPRRSKRSAAIIHLQRALLAYAPVKTEKLIPYILCSR
jgi:hypothetical protein